MESIRSVQENPFFKHFGIKHNIPAATKTDGHIFRQSSISVEDDDIGEYHPMSGFVHKLKDKFASLGAKEEYSSFRRSTSLDELLVDSEVVTSKLKVSTESAAHTGNDKFSTASKLSYKAKSIEGLNHAHQKPQQFSQRTSPQHAARNLNKDRQLSGTGFHGDLDLARDDIIIIEKTPSSPVKGPKVDGSGERDGSGTHFVIGREIISKDELPKPNTVLTVRSIFESASSAASLNSRRQRTDPQLSPVSPSSRPGMSPLHTDVTFSNLDSVAKRASVQNLSPLTSPRPVSDTYVLLPANSVHTRTSDYSKRLSDSYRSEDLKGPSKSNVTVESPAEYSSSVGLAKENIPDSSSSSRSATSGDNKSSSFEHDNIPDGSKSSSSQYSFTSSRSTASVRPTFSHKQNTAVKPVALSPPASATTSYQKSRPVVSVAPYKDKPEDKDDGHPVMIFSKSDISKHGEKSQITNERTQTSISSSAIIDQNIEPEQNSIPLREAKKMFEKDNATYEPNNKLLSHEKRFSGENNKNSEKIKADTSRIIQTKKETTIEIRSLTGDADREQAIVGDSSSNMETDTSFKFAKPAAASRTGLTAPKRMAPEPPAQVTAKDNISVLPAAQISTDNLSKMSSDSHVSNEGSHQEIRKEQTAPSKRLHPKDATVSNEEPIKKVIKDKDENEQPVKGIPSIIAQRLKQQSSTPSQAADDVTSSSDVSASSQNNNIYSRTVLSSVSSNNSKSSTDNAKQDTLSSEIENEITAVRRKMEANRLKSSGPAQIFDSSQLAKKKKENRKQESSGRMVPLLDLSGIIVEDVMEYQPQMRKIKPCNIVFIGENTKTSRSLLDKKRKVKISIHFSHNITETFEYPSEEVALESYLQEHPHEKEEILILEEFSAVNGESGESSDDVEIDVYLTPAASDSDSLLKSNTGLAHSGSPAVLSRPFPTRIRIWSHSCRRAEASCYPGSRS
ncbi:unnamed protein product [Candidula unifasciata]|uniref:Uncharacterized protein n=1 Tax=Candidula unifasciata TaxID=100452 RepID=A0A8S3YQ91_9EUPU|nr:unnamed protein product [Candidula unifasciata]